MSQDLKLTYWIVLVMLLLAEALALTGVVRAPHTLWLAELSVGNVGTYALFIVVLYAFSRPPWGEARIVAVAGAALAAVAVYSQFPPVPGRTVWDWLFIAAVGFGASALVAWVLRLARGTGNAKLTRDLLAASGIAPLADPTVSAFLNLTLALQPVTFDVGAYRVDATLGFQPSATLALLGDHLPWLMVILIAAYMFQPYGISLLYAMQRAAPKRQSFSIIAFQAVTALLSALLFYHLYPVTGPKYAFGAAFPAALPDAAQLQGISSLVPRGARNGVPSMHFAWAFALWLGARQLATGWVRALFAVWLGLTVLSTLALGEHYLIDLVVAVPLTVGVAALCALGSPWRRERVRAVWVGMGLTLAWMLALRFASGLLTAVPVLAWIAVAGTVAVSAVVFRRLERVLRPEPSCLPEQEAPPQASREARADPVAGRAFAVTDIAARWFTSVPFDVRITLGVFLLALALAELAGVTGIVPPPHVRFVGIAASPHAVIILGGLAQTFCILYACSRPGWREFAAVSAWSALLTALYIALRPHEAAAPASALIAIFAGAFTACAIAALAVRIHGAPSKRPLAIALIIAFMLYASYNSLATALLYLTAALHPRTYDAIAFNLDATLGFDPSIALALLVNNWPPVLQVVTAAYVYLPFGFAVLYGLQLARPQRAPVSVLLAFAVSGVAALVLYNACPIAGPRYAFGEQYFVWWAGPPPNELIPTLPTARNAMPSMHFGWALLLWMHATFLGHGVRAVFAVLAGLIFIATLALGQHYLVDLVAAVPAVIALQALCATGLGWDRAERKRAILVGTLLTAGWILAVRYGIALFSTVPGLTWMTMIATVAASVWAYVPFARALRGMPPAVLREGAARSRMGREVRYVGLMFVISGCAALVYQVLFSKVLALTFGSQATATYTVLAVYMGGMALGAWLGGRLASRHLDALKLYAWCELGIGAYCLATPWIFEAIQAAYVMLATGMVADAGVLTVLRVLLGAAALTVPTVLMGATLPILARYFEGRAASLGVSVALLYGANTVGAAVGALLAGYAIIPALGVWKTTLLAAALNFVVVWLAFRLRVRSEPPAAQLSARPRAAEAASPGGAEARRLGWLALVILGAGGIVTLALEVNYIHLLAVVAGNSVYAFSLMLFTFLLGLAAGAELARRLLALALPLVPMLAWFEFALAAVILAGVYSWEGLPAYFASFESYRLTRGFGAREVVRGLVCFVAMFPPAVMIGAIYPLAMECVGRAHVERPIAALGRAAAFNTAGNIVGVLAAGFWLLPAIGALRSIQLLAVICLALGTMALTWTALRQRPLAWAPAIAVVALLLAQPRSLDYTALASGANVYFAAQAFGRVIDHAESMDGGLTTVTAINTPGREALRVLLTNGKFQGTNDMRGEGAAQAGFALAPLLHTGNRDRALVIGYGTGMSARVLHDAGFAALDIVDLSADIVRLANQYFGGVNGQVTSRPGVQTFITDGRNFLLLQERTYDVISMEVTSIWFAGAASLYNREFYALAKRRLAPGGVLQQWLQLHNLHPHDVLYVLGTVRAEFRHVWLYLIGGQGVIVATNSPAATPQPVYVERIERTAAHGPLFELHGGSMRRLNEMRLLDPDGVDRLLKGFKAPPGHWVSTDDNLHLEYSTPRGNVLDGAESFRLNVKLLRQDAGPDRN